MIDTDQIEIEETRNEEPAAGLSPEDLLTLQEMAELGLLFGFSKSRTHPRMKPFIHSTRSGVEIINLEQTIRLLKAAAAFLREIVTGGKTILFVGTAPASKTAVKEIAEKLGQPYVTERWFGGTLTNFKVFSARIEKFNRLREEKEKGGLDKYTKKERLMIDREMEKMEIFLGGVRKMKGLPAALVVIDSEKHKTTVREAKKINIPVVAVLNTNANPEMINYPIPANDRNPKSIAWILNYLLAEIEKANQPEEERPAEKQEQPAE